MIAAVRTPLDEKSLGIAQSNIIANAATLAQEPLPADSLPPSLSTVPFSNASDLPAFIDTLPELPLVHTDLQIDEPWTEGVYDPEWFDLDPVAYYGSNHNSCGFLPNVPNIVDEIDRFDVLMSTDNSATPLSTGLGTFSDR